MTTIAESIPQVWKDQAELDFSDVASPIVGETKARVDLVGNDWNADDDWRKFKAACKVIAALAHGAVDPNEVRTMLTDQYGELTIEPRRYSAFWARAAGKHGFLYADSWGTNTDTHGGNAGKPMRLYRMREAS